MTARNGYPHQSMKAGLSGERQLPNRRSLLRLGAAMATGLALTQLARTPGTSAAETAGSTTGDDALARLLEGNKRYVAGQPQHPDQSLDRRTTVAAGQTPIAFVLGCYDSRVSHELVFDQGLGDIFSSRTAGNLLDDAVLGGIEFGVEEFHVPLLLIMGHQRCGAVKATVDALESGAGAPGSIGSVVQAIRPAVEAVESHPGDLLDNSVRSNVLMGVARVISSPVLAELMVHGKLKVAGAYYSLDTGSVEVIADGVAS